MKVAPFALIALTSLLLSGGTLHAAAVEMDALKALGTATAESGSASAEANSTYTVVPGDTLRKIAQAFLGDADRWPEIYRANQDKISDPHWIYPGQRFQIKGGKGVPASDAGNGASGSGGTAQAAAGASQGKGDKPFNKALPLPRGKFSVTSNFGMRTHPITGGRKMHGGIDLGAGRGTPVHATGPGKVIVASAGENGGYGNLVKIQHDDGTVTVYAHLQTGSLKVRPGQRVEAGAHLAGVNSTGMSTGDHLHFEVRPGGSDTADPARFWSF